MKFIKRELLQIPTEQRPYLGELAKETQLIMTAKLVNYHGEKLLVATFYDVLDGSVYCRIFCHRTKHISYMAGAREWRTSSIGDLKAPRASAKTYWKSSLLDVTIIADEKSARAGERYFHSGKKDTLEAIRTYQAGLISTKATLRAKERADIKGKIMARFPPLPDVEAAVLDGPLRDSRYLFYHRGKARDPLTGILEPVYVGYCTHCKRESLLDWSPKHKEENRRCPACGSMVQTRAAGLKRGGLVDKCSYLVFGKSASGAVLAWYLRVTRDYSGDYRKVTTNIRERERYYFATGEALKFVRTPSYWGNTTNDTWEKREFVSEPQADGTMYNRYIDYTIHPFAPDFFNDTALRHAHFADYLTAAKDGEPKTCYEDPLRIGWAQKPMTYLREYVKHPAIEHLLSAGLYPIIADHLSHHHAARGMMDWSRSRPRDILGLPQPELEMVAAEQLDSSELSYYKRIRLLIGRPADIEDILFVHEMAGYAPGRLEDMLNDGDTSKIIGYFRRQKRKCPDADYRRLYTSFEDYQHECRQLNYDLTREEIKYPHDLTKAHQKTMELIRQMERIEAAKKNAGELKKYAVRIKSLEAYCYEDAAADLMIRAARSRQELVEEGADLDHCVGSYATWHLDGGTTMFFIRKLSAPEQSYFTLEFRGGEIQQNRGLKNCDPPDEVKQFAQRWLDEVAMPIYQKEQRKKNKDRVKVPA